MGQRKLNERGSFECCCARCTSSCCGSCGAEVRLEAQDGNVGKTNSNEQLYQFRLYMPRCLSRLCGCFCQRSLFCGRLLKAVQSFLGLALAAYGIYAFMTGGDFSAAGTGASYELSAAASYTLPAALFDAPRGPLCASNIESVSVQSYAGLSPDESLPSRCATAVSNVNVCASACASDATTMSASPVIADTFAIRLVDIGPIAVLKKSTDGTLGAFGIQFLVFWFYAFLAKSYGAWQSGKFAKINEKCCCCCCKLPEENCCENATNVASLVSEWFDRFALPVVVIMFLIQIGATVGLYDISDFEVQSQRDSQTFAVRIDMPLCSELVQVQELNAERTAERQLYESTAVTTTTMAGSVSSTSRTTSSSTQPPPPPPANESYPIAFEASVAATCFRDEGDNRFFTYTQANGERGEMMWYTPGMSEAASKEIAENGLDQATQDERNAAIRIEAIVVGVSVVLQLLMWYNAYWDSYEFYLKTLMSGDTDGDDSWEVSKGLVHLPALMKMTRNNGDKEPQVHAYVDSKKLEEYKLIDSKWKATPVSGSGAVGPFSSRSRSSHQQQQHHHHQALSPRRGGRSSGSSRRSSKRNSTRLNPAQVTLSIMPQATVPLSPRSMQNQNSMYP